MAMTRRSATVERWGDSFAVRIPSELARALNLREGDVIDIQVELARSPETKVQNDRRVALALLRRLRRPLPPDCGFRRDDFAE